MPCHVAVNPTSVLSDVADATRTAVKYTVQEASQLIAIPELRVRMSDDEYEAFLRLDRK